MLIPLLSLLEIPEVGRQKTWFPYAMTDEEIQTVSSDFVSLLKDLTSTDENIMRSLDDYIEMMN